MKRPDVETRKFAGYVWYDHDLKQRPFYEPTRQIKRGKKKGWFEIWMLHATDDYGLHLIKRIVPATSLRWAD
jgi:hypothetical protein